MTNAPYARPIVVEELPFTGTLPPDWGIEAYRSGQLVSFDSVGADGRYAIALPVRYGENPTEFIAYGPFGEVRTFNRTFRALPEMLSAGSFEYSVALGQCDVGLCSTTGNLDLRYGASRRLTFRSGLERDWDRAGSSGHVYASVLGAPTNAFGVELETLRGQSDRAGLRFEPTNRLRLTADWIDYRPNARAPYAPPGEQSAWAVSGRLAPSNPATGVEWQGQATGSRWTSGVRREAQLGFAARTAAAYLRPYVRAERTDPVTTSATTIGYLGVEATVLPRPGLPRPISGIWVRGDAEMDWRGAVSRAAVTASKNVGAVARIEAGIRWARSMGGAALSLAIVTQSPAVRASTLGTQPLGGPGRLEQRFSGSMVWDPSASDVIWSSEPAAERGGIAGTVFLDRDGDGIRGPDEPALAGARVLVASQWVTCDSSGRFARWGIAPFEPVTVGIDSTSLRFPWWVPREPVYTLQVGAGRFTEIALPVSMGTTVEGRVIWSKTRELPPGLTLRLKNLQTGAIRPLTLFSDGSFYETGLQPGEYEVVGAVDGTGGTEQSTARISIAPVADPEDESPPLIANLLVTLTTEAEAATAYQR